MSETPEVSPFEAMNYTLPSKVVELRFAALGEVERAAALLFTINALVLPHIVEPSTLESKRYSPSARYSAVAAIMLASALVVGCGEARDQAVGVSPVVTESPTEASMAFPTLLPTERPVSPTAIPQEKPAEQTVTATSVMGEAPTAAPTVEREIPAWAQGFTFGEVVYATENGELVPLTTMTFTTPDGVVIEIDSRPRALADIRAEDPNADPYDYRRADNAVLQNWVRETGRTVPLQTVHSASGAGGPLSGEALREWLEEKGGLFGSRRSSEEMAQQAQSLTGVQVTVEQDGRVEKGTIAMVLRADANELEEYMSRLHPDQQRYPNQFATYDYLDYFDRGDYWQQTANKEHVMYMFCGRDASDEKNNGRDRLETHRWIVVVESIDSIGAGL